MISAGSRAGIGPSGYLGIACAFLHAMWCLYLAWPSGRCYLSCHMQCHFCDCFPHGLCCSDKPGRDVIEVADSMWTIDAGSAGDDYADNTVVISLAKPEVSEEERKWKKGRHTTVFICWLMLLHLYCLCVVCCRQLHAWQVTLHLLLPSLT